MSLECDIVIEGEGVPDIPEELGKPGENSYGLDAGYCGDALDEICKEAGVTGWLTFHYDNGEIHDEIERRGIDDLDEGRRLLFTLGDWHDSSDGLTTVRAILERLSAGAECLDGKPAGGVRGGNLTSRYQGLLWDMKAYELILEKAVAAGKRFRVELG